MYKKVMIIFIISILCITGCTKEKKTDTSKSNEIEYDSIVKCDSLANLSEKEFKEAYAKLPDNYTIKLDNIKLCKKILYDKDMNPIKINKDGTITKKEIGNVKQIITYNVDYMNKKDNEYTGNLSLKGLRYFYNLYDVSICECKLSYLEELNYLNFLENLVIEDCNLTKIDFFKNYSQIQFLDFGKNNISDIKPLSKLKKISSLVLSYNRISDISALTNASSEGDGNIWIDLSNNQIEDILPLRKLISDGGVDAKLYLENNKISNITSLSKMKTAREIFLYNNNIKDISPLSNLQVVYFLTLAGNPLKEIYPLKNLKIIHEEEDPGWIDLSNTNVNKKEAKKMFGKLVEVKKKEKIEYDEYE